MPNPARVGIAGASGYVGEELLRLLAGHEGFEVVFIAAGSRAGQLISGVSPQLADLYPGQRFVDFNPLQVPDLDFLFCALKSDMLHKWAPPIAARAKHVIDTSADFRLTREHFKMFYREDHHSPSLLPSFSCGIPELFRDQIAERPHVAAPGCYATAAILSLAPLIDYRKAIATRGISISASSGWTGLGRGGNEEYLANAQSATVGYGLGKVHRHVPEIEGVLRRFTDQNVSVSMDTRVVKSPRGISMTCTLPGNGLGQDQLTELFARFYHGRPFVDIMTGADSLSEVDVLGTQCIKIFPHRDGHTGLIKVMAVIDNLTRGAAGNAVQSANIKAGYDEVMGLELSPLPPTLNFPLTFS